MPLNNPKYHIPGRICKKTYFKPKLTCIRPPLKRNFSLKWRSQYTTKKKLTHIYYKVKNKPAHLSTSRIHFSAQDNTSQPFEDLVILQRNYWKYGLSLQRKTNIISYFRPHDLACSVSSENDFCTQTCKRSVINIWKGRTSFSEADHRQSTYFSYSFQVLHTVKFRN